MNNNYLQKLQKLNQSLVVNNQPEQQIKISDVYKKIIELTDNYLKQTINTEYVIDAQILLLKE